jgi:hypothetical protein
MERSQNEGVCNILSGVFKGLGVEYIAEEIYLIKFLYCTVTVIKRMSRWVLTQTWKNTKNRLVNVVWKLHVWGP